MEDKKKIDRLFREKFKDFEVTPDEQVWKNIKADLQKEDKAMVFPLWSKIAGVAAVLAIAFLVGNYWIKNDSESTFVKSDKKEKTEQISTDSFDRTIPSDKKENTIVKDVADKEEKEQENSKIKTEQVAKSPPKKEEAKKAIATSNPQAKEAEKSISDKTGSDLGEKQKSDEKALAFEENADIEKKVKPEEDVGEIAEKKQESEKSIWEAIAKQEKDDFSVKKESGRLSIRPNVAPIYYSSIGGGSAMDPQFADSKAQGRLTMAYGLDVAYKVSNQLKIRAGISRLNMSYNTPDIAFASAPRDVSLRALIPNNSNMPQMDHSAVIQSAAKSKIEKSNTENSYMVSAYSDGNLNQELTYIEVPLEVEYSLLDKRFGISLIGGASTLILNDDLISLHSGVETTELGRATNLNSVSFTTNIGMGFGYNLNKNLNFSVEPTLKYQINGFNGKTGDFKPYFLGVYSGLSFKF